MAANLDDQLLQLGSRLDSLERLVQTQIQRIHALEMHLRAPSVAMPAVAAPPAQLPTLPHESQAPEADPSRPPLPAHVATGSGATGEQAFGSTSVSEVAVQESLESQIGGNLLNKIGMAAIILGMAYFLKYAIDNEWIGETGRVIIGILTGLGFLAWGEHLHRKSYHKYAITVLGGGVAILYFSIFAAYSFYQLIPQLPALLLMMLITTATVVMSLRHDSRTVAVFATVGGFMTPTLLSTGRDNQLGLFAYVLLLDLGVLALAYFKNWRALNLLAFFLTQLMFIGWASSFYTEAKLWQTEFLLTIFFFLFAVMSFLYNIAHQQKTTFRDLSLITLNGACYFLWTYGLLKDDYFRYLGFYAVLMAVTYVGLGSFAWRRAPQDGYLFLVFLGLGLTSLTLAIPIQLKQNWITIGWAIEAAMLTWVGFRLESSKTRRAALAIATMVAFRLLFLDSSFSGTLSQDFIFIFNRRAFAFLVGVGSIFAMAFLYAQNRERLEQLEAWLISGLFVAANLLALFFFTTEIANVFEVDYRHAIEYRVRRQIRSRMQLAVSALWGFHSIVLVTVGILRRIRPFRLLAILLFGATILKVFLVDLREMEKIYSIITFIGLGVLLLAVAMMYQKYRAQINGLVLK